MNTYEVTIPNQNTIWVQAKNVAGAKSSARQNFGLSKCPSGTKVKKVL